MCMEQMQRFWGLNTGPGPVPIWIEQMFEALMLAYGPMARPRGTRPRNAGQNEQQKILVQRMR